MAQEQEHSRMRSVEIQARTVDEAVQLALEHLDKKIDEVDVAVLNAGSADESDEALVRVTVKGPGPSASPRARPFDKPLARSPFDTAQGRAQGHAQDFAGPRGAGSVRPEAVSVEEEEQTERVATETLSRLLDLMGIRADIAVHRVEDDDVGGPSLKLDITGDDLGILIGRKGETLLALQYLVSLFVSKKLKRRTQLLVDVESYRARRAESLVGLANRVAERVVASRRPIALESMPAYERRIVHLALQNSEDVSTASVGEGDERRVVISPKVRHSG